MAKRRNADSIIAVLVLIAATIPLGLHAIQKAGSTPTAAAKILPLDEPIPDAVPEGTKLVIGDPTTQRVLEYTGWDKKLPFKVEWAAISGGPGVTEAFHARAIDIGSAANIPPIHAIWVGIPVKIIAFRLRADPLNHPTYVIGVSPKANINSVADLKGKRIAFSRGQAQGAVVLRTLEKAGISPKDVTLVDLPATSDVYSGALAAGLVDAAPIGGGLPAKRYLDSYGKDGAKVIAHGAFRDDPGVLYVRTETLQDPAKAAAIRQYVRFWARAQAWVQTHRDEWIQAYYVKDQGVSVEDAQAIVRNAGNFDIPAKWGQIIPLQQETIDFMARETSQKRFDASTLFDRRFESVAATAVADAQSRPAVHASN